MGLINAVFAAPFASLATLPLLFVAFLIIRSIYRLYFHPLSHIPGPLFARISSLYLNSLAFRAIECHKLSELHTQYNASVIRVGPNAVSVSDGAALHPIYVAGGGFVKDARYRNFDIDGHATIFSATDPAYRDARAKAVAPLFAMGRIRAAAEGNGIIKTCVDKFVELFLHEKTRVSGYGSSSKKLDLMDLAMKLTVDVTTGYLFDLPYGDLDPVLLSNKAPSSVPIAPSIHKLIGIGGISLLPNWLFGAITAFFMTLGRLFPDAEFDASLSRIDAFESRVMDRASPEKPETFPSRLLAAGISPQEVQAQCKAVTFAGTDSTAIMLITLLFHLTQNSSVRQKLSEEIRARGGEAGCTDPQTLPYLRAVVKEGMRVAMANPARLTRIVPPAGIEVGGRGGNGGQGGTFLPGGTNVGVSAYTLHHNPELFPDAFTFKPERWLDGEDEGAGAVGTAGGVGKAGRDRKKQMERDVFPFGVGNRTCIARNFATRVLFVATRAVVESGVLEGARTVEDKIKLEEYFNVGVKGHVLEIEW